MKKILAFLLALALTLSLAACGSKPSEEATAVYKTICENHDHFEQIKAKMYKVCELIDRDPDQVRNGGFAYLAQELDVDEESLRRGAACAIKGEEWYNMSEEDRKMMAFTADVGLLLYGSEILGEHALHDFCLKAVSRAYWENRERGMILVKLDGAKEALAAIQDDPQQEALSKYLSFLCDYMYYVGDENLESYYQDDGLIDAYTEIINTDRQELEKTFGPYQGE